ncbi:thiamine pyrophosphokinase [Aureimonas altamirensis DSM 21988]|uniref:Thiamine diphosphokinase n=2 Tax=Aureimonas altamirensis TaxID=370622 RepID=A0A0P0YVP9_9HYPH|nr:thiamine diphosphokinase [Aureimonas altamirensis]BAT25496.1 putative thiamin pyrophosphokinase [Aureimonas altamirensis]SHK02694.1 thiamine pyrophosphokinase [Aureimonas altamirensis DSM 21988]
MTSFALLLAGDISAGAALRAAIAGRRVIAADAGLRHAAALGVTPDLIVGDFDSVDPATLDAYPLVPRHDLPRDKGETDGETALRLAADMGAVDLLVIGALGGARTDHAFSNLNMAVAQADRFDRLWLFDGREHVFPLVPGRTLRHAAQRGMQFSVCKFSALSGLTIRGAKWPLGNIELPFGSLLTQSNEALGPVEIEISAGRAFAIFSAQE